MEPKVCRELVLTRHRNGPFITLERKRGVLVQREQLSRLLSASLVSSCPIAPIFSLMETISYFAESNRERCVQSSGKTGCLT